MVAGAGTMRMQPAKSHSRSRRLGGVIAGGVGTALLHTLLVLPFFLDLSPPSHPLPNRRGAGASALASTEEPVMTVVFINDVSPVVERLAPAEPQHLASRGKEVPDLPVVVFSPDPLPAGQSDAQSEDSPDSSGAESARDQTEHALLYARYVGPGAGAD